MVLSAYNNTMWIGRRVIDAARDRMSSDDGNAMVEYALLFALIVLVCISAVTLLGSQTSDNVSRSASSVAAAN